MIRTDTDLSILLPQLLNTATMPGYKKLLSQEEAHFRDE